MSDPAPKLDNPEIPDESDLEILSPDSPKSPESPEVPPDEDAKEEACVVVKDDATPRGRRLADEAREVAAAHASMLLDVEACKRVSMARSLRTALIISVLMLM